MFDELLINPRTAANLERYLLQPAQALLLSGPAGAGKGRLARILAARLLEIPTEKIVSYHHFLVYGLPKDKQEIPIDSVRDIIKRVKLQVPGDKKVRRVILIENAHLMNSQAQNAFLKALEEPAPGTIFLMSATSKTELLPTILSRVASVSVDPIDLNLAIRHFSEKKENDVRSAWALSQGAAGLLESLLSGEENQLKNDVDRAKVLLKMTPYDRLLELDSLKDKTELAGILDGLSRVIKALYRASAERGDKRQTQALTRAVAAILEAQSDLSANVLPRLVILKLVLELPV